MDTRRWVPIVLTLGLVVAACSPDSAGPPTTSVSTTQTTVSEGTTTTAGATTSTVDATDTTESGATEACFFLDGYVIVAQEDAEAAIAVGVEVEPAFISEVLGESEAAGELEDNLELLSTGGNPPAVAVELAEEAEIDASPVYAMGLAGHWKLKPGTDPIPRPGATIPAPTTTQGERIVAVVDSGIVDDPNLDDLPDWMSPEHVLYDNPEDTETIGPTPASHGTFVTSLIRQLAPEHRVAFAAVRPVDVADIGANGERLPPGISYMSTELHVAEAIVRLTQRSELEDGIVDALNLSLGTYTCDPGEDPVLVATTTALRLWFAKFPSSRLFAAGGNEEYNSPFWPAALSRYQLDPGIDRASVGGVGALDQTMRQVVWGQGAASTAAVVPRLAPNRLWITDVAPGCDLLGLRGGLEAGGAPAVVAWSGSSFATAVSAAMYAAGVPPTSVGPPVEFDYGAPNLKYESLGCDGTP
ncbi:MAG: S8/S53 family peptidase [Acidimicrobiia bacterium]